MKITKKQLRRLIEGSIKKRGDYVIPVEDPIEDPIAGLDYSDEQKPKIKTLAMSDDEQNQVYANFIADMGGHEDTDQFGADTFSKKVQAYDLDVNLLKKDMDLDSAIAKACQFWIYERKDELSYYDHIDQDNSRKYADYMIELYGGDQAVANKIKVHTTAVLDKRIESLIEISNSAAPVPSVDEEVAKYETAKKLFSTDHNNPIVEEHILFKLYSVLYPFYFDWKSYYEEEQGYDMSNPEHVKRYKENISTFKEGKVRLTRGKLRKLIESFIAGDDASDPDNVQTAKKAFRDLRKKAAKSIDDYRTSVGKSKIGRDMVFSKDPETAQQGIELGFDRAPDEFTDYEKTARDIPRIDRRTDRPLDKHDALLKAKYGQGQGLGEVYSLVVQDNTGKEVLIPIIDDHSSEEKKRGEGIPDTSMFVILDTYRRVKHAEMLIKNSDLENDDFSIPPEQHGYSLLQYNATDDLEDHYIDLLEDHVWEVLSSPPYNYDYKDVQNFAILRIEPQHKELEAALTFASGLV
jgi:hypothetical protein